MPPRVPAGDPRPRAAGPPAALPRAQAAHPRAQGAVRQARNPHERPAHPGSPPAQESGGLRPGEAADCSMKRFPFSGHTRSEAGRR